MLGKFPDLPVFSPAKGRWIHDDSVVEVSPAKFALEEGEAVLDKITDRLVAQS